MDTYDQRKQKMVKQTKTSLAHTCCKEVSKHGCGKHEPSGKAAMGPWQAGKFMAKLMVAKGLHLRGGDLLCARPLQLSLGKRGLLGFLEAEECHVVCITHRVIDRLPSPALGTHRPNWCSHWSIVCLSLWSQNLRPSYFCNQNDMLKRWWSSI